MNENLDIISWLERLEDNLGAVARLTLEACASPENAELRDAVDTATLSIVRTIYEDIGTLKAAL